MVNFAVDAYLPMTKNGAPCGKQLFIDKQGKINLSRVELRKTGIYESV